MPGVVETGFAKERSGHGDQVHAEHLAEVKAVPRSRRVESSKNPSENMICPMSLERKNWLICRQVNAGAILASMPSVMIASSIGRLCNGTSRRRRVAGIRMSHALASPFGNKYVRMARGVDATALADIRGLRSAKGTSKWRRKQPSKKYKFQDQRSAAGCILNRLGSPKWNSGTKANFH